MPQPLSGLLHVACYAYPNAQVSCHSNALVLATAKLSFNSHLFFLLALKCQAFHCASFLFFLEFPLPLDIFWCPHCPGIRRTKAGSGKSESESEYENDDKLKATALKTRVLPPRPRLASRIKGYAPKFTHYATGHNF